EAKTEKSPEPESKPAAKAAKSDASSIKAVHLPDLGSDDAAEVIDVLVKVGDEVGEEGGLITLETDKAAMDVPASLAGIVKAIKVKVGDKVKTGDHIADIEVSGAAAEPEPAPAAEKVPAKAPEPQAEPAPATAERPVSTAVPASSKGAEVYAGPAVRKLARELGVDLSLVSGSGL